MPKNPLHELFNQVLTKMADEVRMSGTVEATVDMVRE